METKLCSVMGATLTAALLLVSNSAMGQPVFDVNITGTATLTSYGSYTQIYRYDYVLTFATSNTKDISHWSLELSTCGGAADLIDPAAFSGTWTFEKPCFMEPVVSYSICGLKWEAGGNYSSGTFSFSFYSLGNPTTVNWYAKDGSSFTEQGTTTGPNCDNPISVELTSFAAYVTAGVVVLRWSTATETENLGFHVFRSLQAYAEYGQITTAMIGGAGSSPQAQSYFYVDRHVEVGKTYYYKLADVDFNGNLRFHGPVSATVLAVPEAYALQQNYPNPFNPETAISYSLKSAGAVKLTIINNLGQTVRTLVDANQQAGSHSVLWNGRDDQGRLVASGIYLYRLEVNGFSEVKKLVFSK